MGGGGGGGFQIGGFIFKYVCVCVCIWGGGGCPMGEASVLMGGVSKKIVGWEAPPTTCPFPTMGNPAQQYIIASFN